MIVGLLIAVGVASMLAGEPARSQRNDTTILQHMTDRSSDVIAVTCDNVTGGMTDREGVEEWTAACRVDITIKGKLSEGKKILIHFNRFTFGKKPEPLRFTKGERFVVFLDGLAGTGTAAPGMDPMPVYRLLDRWLSVQAYDWHLVRGLKPDVKEEA